MKDFLQSLALALLLCFLVSQPSFGQAGNDNPTGVTGEYNGSITTGGSYDPYTGNGKRFVTDLTVTGSVGAYPLKWTRILNTRQGSTAGFGQGGAWTHNYRWGLWVRGYQAYEFHENQYEGPDGVVTFPDGATMTLEVDELGNYTQKNGVEPLGRIQNTGGGNYDLIMADGGRVKFEHPPGTSGGYSLVATQIVDPHGQTTLLSRDSAGRLSRITEPAGRYLQINYQTFSYTWPPSGETIRFDYISSVQAFAGPGNLMETVNYLYTPETEQSYQHKYLNLTRVNYDDTTYATYSYLPSDGANGLIGGRMLTCRDVRHAGPMSNIKYEYMAWSNTHRQVAVGQVKRERNLTTNQIISEVIYPPSYPESNDPSRYQRTELRPDGSSRSFQYSNDGNAELQNYTDFKNQSSRIDYALAPDESHYLRIVTDARGNTTSTEKDRIAGAVMAVTRGNGPPVIYTYSDSGNPYYVSSRRDERGYITYHDRDNANRIWQTRYPDGGIEQFSYDQFGQIETHTMPMGGVENFRYDTRGLKYLSWPPATPSDPDPWNHPTRYFYYTSGPHTDRLWHVIDPRGNATWFEYNGRGQVTRTTHQDGTYIQSGYNADGTLAWTADENHPGAANDPNQRTRYTYDEYKRVLTVTNPMNQTTINSYAPWNMPGDFQGLSHTTSSLYWTQSPMGKITHFNYDENFRRYVTRQAPGTVDDAWTWFGYDEVGNLTSTTDPRGKLTTFAYDHRNRQIRVTDALGQTTATTYDYAGNKTSVTRPNNPPIQFVEYDPMNRLKRQIDENGYQSSMAYDQAGNLQYQFDERNNLYYYHYDLMNRKVKMDYPGGTTQEWHYDRAGNLANHKNRAGAWQGFAYDNRNRQTWFEWSDGTQPQLTIYDAASRVTSIHNWEADITPTYDDANRKTSETEAIKSYGLWATRSTVYEYDDDGNRSRVKYPQGYEFIYAYTQRNQLEHIKLDPAIHGAQYNTPVVRYTYDLAGNRATRTVLSGAHADYDIDNLNRIRAQANYFANGLVGRFDYGFDAMGRRRYEQRDWGMADGYEHDPTDQITGYKRDGTLNADGTVTAGFGNSSTLSYDGTGNRIQVSGMSGSSYAVNSLNQYTSASNVGSLDYDPKGNLTSADGWTYSYDAQNRLTRMERPGTVIVMTYDPLNRIVTRNVNGAVTQNVWEGWNLIEEHRPDWSIQRCYVAGANQNEMVAAFDGNVYSTHWFWQDGRGNTSHITGDPGNLLERYTYDLSGAPKFYDENGWARFESIYDTRFLFAGSQYMPGTGLYDMRNRFYHITLNRFLQTDPVGFKGDQSNLYRYCHNDPVDRTDPMGLLSGFNKYELVRDDHPLDDTHDGWKIGGMKGTEVDPGASGVRLEVDRSVTTVERIGNSTKGAGTTTTLDVANKSGQPTIHAQIDVRYAKTAGEHTRAKSLGSEFQHSKDSVAGANHVRDIYAGRVRGMSTDAAIGLIRDGDRRGPRNTWTPPLKGRMGYEGKIYWESFRRWDAPFLRSPRGMPLSPHSPVDQNGEPVPFWQ